MSDEEKEYSLEHRHRHYENNRGKALEYRRTYCENNKEKVWRASVSIARAIERKG